MEACSPTDLIAANLLSCALTVMGIEVDKRSADFSGASGHITKHMTADLHRRVHRLVCTISLPATLGDEDWAALIATAEGCPTCRSLSAEMDVQLNVV